MIETDALTQLCAAIALAAMAWASHRRVNVSRLAFNFRPASRRVDRAAPLC